ncbi:unnamed protein product [Pleuronectes platessa]|uniref:Uncharacterized protein n=1 Tax=Pleuronectes platessa TaxID=8262 RepID=A0A9N7TUL6_PLEPL|nr:unnamed protein product [Pleuronectes platessa]
MLTSRRTQMDSLVQPLVAQYLAMGCQSKENHQNESASPDEKGKDDAATPRCSSRARVSPPGLPHRFHRPSPAQTAPSKSMMPMGPLTKGASWEGIIQACLQSFDSSGCVCGSGHLLNITLTMHRLLISSSDLLDKLITLYPSTARGDAPSATDDSNSSLANLEKPRVTRGQITGSLCAAFVSLSTATGDQARTWLPTQPGAVSAKL